MMVMVVMMPPAMVMMVVVMVPVGELDAFRLPARALLLVQRLQACARIRDRLQQFGIGVGGEHVSRRRCGSGLYGPQGSERGHRSQKSGHLFFQGIVSQILPQQQTVAEGNGSGERTRGRKSMACVSFRTRDAFSDFTFISRRRCFPIQICS